MKKFFLTLVVLIVCHQLFAQQIVGKIVDERNMPMQFVNVELLSLNDSTFIKGAVTGNDGQFSISHEPTAGILKCSFIGYQTIYKTLQGAHVGTLVMQEKATELSGVTVKGNLPAMKVELNKITVDVSHSYLQYMGKAIDVLRRVPGLTSGLQLLEGGTPTFILNGKVVSTKELAAIPSSEIKKIVVDANPTVEYSATNKGVVYITTKTELGNMLSSEISNTSIFARNYMDMVNATVNEKYKKVSNLLTFGFSHLNTTQIDHTTETVYLPQTTIESAKERKTRGRGNVFDWFYAMNWALSKKQTIGFQYTGNIGNSRQNEPTTQFMNGETMKFVQRKNGEEWLHTASVSYENKIDSTRMLTFLADYSYHHSNADGAANATPEVITASEGHYNIAGARLSYTSERKWAKLSMGTFFSAMSNKGNYAYNADAENYTTHETLFGAYVSLSKQFKGFYVQGGVRLEADHRKLETHTTGVFADSTQWKLFPNLMMKKTLSNKSSIGLSLGQTIARPVFGDINPGLYYYDAISYKVGNPQLKPAITTNMKLSYTTGNLFTSVAYNRTENKIVELPGWTEQAVGNKNIRWMPVNFDKASTIVATAVYYYSLGPLQGDVTGSFTQPFIKANYLGEEHTWNTPSWYFSVNAQCPVSRHSLVALDGSYDSGGMSTLFNHELSWMLNITYMHRLLHDRLTLVVSVNDIFHTDRGNNWTMKYNRIKTTMNSNMDTRYLMVKLNYNLGKLQLDNSKKTASKELLNRLK